MMRGLAPLPTYDVYSLRILLREQGIKVNDVDALKLSSEKMSELTSYMTDFTHPLIVRIYGGDNMEIHSFEDVLKLFRDPDVEKARTRLQQMADKLEIDLLEVPKFLEDYGDIFLSLSYYRSCLDGIEPYHRLFGDLGGTETELAASQRPESDEDLQADAETINELMAATTGGFESFDRASSQMWSEISAKRFRRVENLIKSMHTTIGGMLCALSVKMDTWNRLFPDKNVGGPVKRSNSFSRTCGRGSIKSSPSKPTRRPCSPTWTTPTRVGPRFPLSLSGSLVKVFRLHRGLARPLSLSDADGVVAAGDQEAIVEDRSRFARAGLDFRGDDLQAIFSMFAPCPRPRGEGANFRSISQAGRVQSIRPSALSSLFA